MDEDSGKKRLRLNIPDEAIKDFSKYRIKLNLNGNNGHKKRGKNHYRIQLRKMGKKVR